MGGQRVAGAKRPPHHRRGRRPSLLPGIRERSFSFWQKGTDWTWGSSASPGMWTLLQDSPT